jgi:hypothetical protein
MVVEAARRASHRALIRWESIGEWSDVIGPYAPRGHLSLPGGASFL